MNLPSQQPPAVHQLSSNLPVVMILTRGHLGPGRPFWAYMCLKNNMAAAFKEARKKGAMNLEQYGTIIEWGEGENPPEETELLMKKKYGMRGNYEELLAKAIDQFS